jgi:Tfp pilus assembly protein PilF
VPEASKDSTERLDSWKEIASFFHRDERTVKRWEKERGLPVHRLQGSPTGRVYAYAHELSQWMKAPASAIPSNLGPEPDAREQEALLDELPSSAQTEAKEVESASPQQATPRRRSTDLQPRSYPRNKWWLAGGLAVVAVAVLGWMFIAHGRNSVHAGKQSALERDRRAGTPAYGSATHTPDPEAHDFYLKGRYEWDKRTPESLTQAVDYFTQAIVHDPNYAEAYVGLADCYNLLREYSAMPDEEAYPRALAAAKKAVELDDASAEAHLSLAFATFFGNFDATGAEREFRRALAISPNSARAHHWYASFLLSRGRYGEALDQIEIAQQLDPGSSPILADKAAILLATDRKQQGIALLKQLQQTDPGFGSTYRYMANACLMDKDFPGYLAAKEHAARLSHDQRALAIAEAGKDGYARGREQGMWEAILEKQKEFFSAGQLPAYDVAVTYSYLGNKPEALHYLNIAKENHESSLINLHNTNDFASLQQDPAFRELVEQLGLQ